MVLLFDLAALMMLKPPKQKIKKGFSMSEKARISMY